LLKYLTLFALLLVFWLLLSGQVDPADPHQRYLIGCGVVSSALATVVAARVGFLYQEGDLFRIVARQLPYLAWLLVQIIRSNVDVAARVWSPRAPIEPEMLHVPYETGSSLTTVIFANSITLTPGTVTVMVNEQARDILVHALVPNRQEGLWEMHDRVRALEGEAS